jgi:beta-1,4-mannosyltransferase
MGMRRLYLFPVKEAAQITNPYMVCLADALSKYFLVVNEQDPIRIGIVQIIKYIRKIDAVYLNWVEELPKRRYGILQTLFLTLLIRYLKAAGIKIIWTLHNKGSHHRERRFLSERIYRLMLKKSDLIITHAREGLKLVGDGPRSVFMHHPVRNIEAGPADTDTPSSDILIWGLIEKYKGIDDFLEYLHGEGVLQDFRIILAGRVASEDLLYRLRSLMAHSDRITLLDEYLPEQVLMSLIRKTRLVVLTYHSESVLSSGVLMDSLSQSAYVIGPDTGAFRDLSGLGLVDTFTDYRQLLEKIHLHLDPQTDHRAQRERIAHFVEENSWDNFSARIHVLIEEIMQPDAVISR